MSTPQAAEFFQAWDTYAKVVADDYMFHRAIGEGVRSALETRFRGRPFSILDLGCGDAATFSPLLEGLPVKSYRGADLSAAALELARKNLSRLGRPVELLQADFMRALEESPAQDAIYASFSLHHLATLNKEAFFRLAARRLAPRGLLLVADVFREEGQGLEAYYRDYCAWLRGAMTGLTAAEQDGVCDHLVNNDFPEPASLLEAQAASAGLAALPGVRPHKWHGLMLFAPA